MFQQYTDSGTYKSPTCNKQRNLFPPTPPPPTPAPTIIISQFTIFPATNCSSARVPPYHPSMKGQDARNKRTRHSFHHQGALHRCVGVALDADNNHRRLIAKLHIHPEQSLGVPPLDLDPVNIWVDLVHEIQKKPIVNLRTQAERNIESTEQRRETQHPPWRKTGRDTFVYM